MNSLYSVRAQSLNSFLKYDGVSVLAGLAHPTSTFDQGFYNIYRDAVDVEIYYEDGVYTKVRLWYRDGWFTRIQVLKDTDWFPPFLGIEFIKNILYEISKESDQSSGIQSAYEKWLDKRIIEFSGRDITLVVMTIGWSNYR